MARLPQPGSDAGTWGSVLNDYLSQSHKPDGTLKDDSVGPGQLQDNAVTVTAIDDGTITEAKLDTSVQAKLNSGGTAGVTSVNTRTGAVTLTKTDVGLANADNTNDANKPISTATQTALNAKASDTSVAHLTGNETIAGIKTFSSSPVVPNPTTATQAANKTYVDTAVAGAGGGATNLDGLSDVVITTPSSGQALKYNGTNWVNDTDATGGGSGVTSVGGTAPIVSSGGTTPAISITAATTSTAGSLSSADKTKLDSVANGATANSSDASLLARANHTGTQASSTITGLGDAATKDTGTASGQIALLGASGRFDIARIASGTPNGTKYVRDDGTLVTPPGGGTVNYGTTAGTAAEGNDSRIVEAAKTWAYLGEAPLDSFAGATDDDKLTAAMTYCSAQTHPPAIRLGNRDYTFALARTMYDGFRLRGGSTISNSELGDANMLTKINLSTNGPWLSTGTSEKFDCEISGISAIGSSVTTFLGGTGIFHCGLIRDVSFKQFKTVLGTQAQKFLMTASIIDGWFQMQGTYNGGIHIGGSDNRLFMTMGLADASQAYNIAGNAAGQFHFWFDGLDNTHIGPLYITAAGLWGAIKVTGAAYNTGIPSNRGMLWMMGATVEGQAASNPCFGALIRVEGGQLKMHSGYIARAMSDPTAQGHSPTDAGYVHVTGGAVLLDGVTWDRANGVSEAVPVVYNNGGVVRIRDSFVATTGGTWAGLPRVQAVSGSSVFDDTMQAG